MDLQFVPALTTAADESNIDPLGPAQSDILPHPNVQALPPSP
jgi:hypothetical protein